MIMEHKGDLHPQVVLEDEKGKTRKLFNGLAQLIVQSNWDSSGAIEIRASAPGLKPAALKIPVKAVPLVPYVAVTPSPKH